MQDTREGHISQEEYDAVCQERDKWADVAMEERKRVLQLEEEVRGLRQALGEQTARPELFCRITHEAYEKGKAMEVENALRSARKSAPKLVKAIRLYEALGYLDTANLNSTELYEMLNEHFGLSFRLRAFQLARSR